MTEPFGTPYIDAGVQAGVERASRHGLEPRGYEIEETTSMLVNVIESWPEEVNERFLVLFVENATVAAIARNFYEAEPLQEDDLRAYLEHSAAFFNSWTHP